LKKDNLFYIQTNKKYPFAPALVIKEKLFSGKFLISPFSDDLIINDP